MNPKHRHSSLTARYNGFMLGHFLAMAALRSLRPPRYPVLRSSVEAFLRAQGLDARLPARAREFQADPFGHALRILNAVRAQSPELASTAWLSSAAIFRARGAPDFQDADFAAAARSLRLDARKVRAYVDALPRAQKVSTSDMLAPAMAFLGEALSNLRSEPRTCFVAMPFHRPFEQRYESFYKPALEQLGYRVIRAWGGVGAEDYLEVILALLTRSGACLAEVTTRNPNVLYELGAAQALGKHVMIASSGPPASVPANVSQHTAFRFHYRPTRRGWQRDEITRFAAQVSLAQFAQEQG